MVDDKGNSMNLPVVALVALVAIVGLVALVMNAAAVQRYVGLGSIATGNQLAQAQSEKNSAGQTVYYKTADTPCLDFDYDNGVCLDANAGSGGSDDDVVKCICKKGSGACELKGWLTKTCEPSSGSGCKSCGMNI